MKRFLVFVLLAVALVGCDKYDDDNLDRYVKKGAKSIEAQKAMEILSDETGFWRANTEKSIVVFDDGKKVPYLDSGIMGHSFDRFEFESDGTINVYCYSYIFNRTTIYKGRIDWDSKVLYVGEDTFYEIRGVTDNYLIIKRYEVIGIYERMSAASVTKYLQNEFVDKRE